MEVALANDIANILATLTPAKIGIIITILIGLFILKEIKGIKKDIIEMKNENAKTEYATVSTFGNGKKQEYWDNKKNWTK